jgi:hypothetical protein
VYTWRAGHNIDIITCTGGLETLFNFVLIYMDYHDLDYGNFAWGLALPNVSHCRWSKLVSTPFNVITPFAQVVFIRGDHPHDVNCE